MKVLVTAATKHGATAEIAAAIGEVLGGEPGLDAAVIPPEQVATIDGYDAVVLGSAVYAGHWLAAAKELVDRAGDALAGKPVWLSRAGHRGGVACPGRGLPGLGRDQGLGIPDRRHPAVQHLTGWQGRSCTPVRVALPCLVPALPWWVGPVNDRPGR